MTVAVGLLAQIDIERVCAVRVNSWTSVPIVFVTKRLNIDSDLKDRRTFLAFKDFHVFPKLRTAPGADRLCSSAASVNLFVGQCVPEGFPSPQDCLRNISTQFGNSQWTNAHLEQKQGRRG
jgi:hypothetical protein